MQRLDAFMADANAAYYASHDPFADFTTAPEISQVFGEVLGLWTAVTWDLLGRPSPVILAEAGPGRGTLMADALRAIRQAAPACHAALRLHLVETSPRLRAIQAERLPDADWHDQVTDLPDGPLLLLANEFLDALPIRQFVHHAGTWAERHVAAAAWVEVPIAAAALPAGVAERAAGDGCVVEFCEPALAIAAHLAGRFTRQPGAALFVDYGPAHSAAGDSLQAIAGGQPADPLSPAGSADLTAHVDFQALCRAAVAAGAAAFGPVPQGIFLARLGLPQRANRLAARLPPRDAWTAMQAVRRLTEPDQMGRLFKAMAIASPGCPPLPGLEAA
jgi:SAM-dependent MidA family methyltransferase